MQTVAKTLLIDRPAGEMTVFIGGVATQRVPIKRTRTLKHLGAIYKKLGYTVIDKKGRKEKQPVASPSEVKRNLFNALIELENNPGMKLNVKTDGALRHRGYITGSNQITPAGLKFMHEYSIANPDAVGTRNGASVTNAPAAATVGEPTRGLPLSPDQSTDAITGSDDSPAINQDAAAAIAVYSQHVAAITPEQSAQNALHNVREIALHAVTEIVRLRAPEALPYIEIVRESDRALNGGK